MAAVALMRSYFTGGYVADAADDWRELRVGREVAGLLEALPPPAQPQRLAVPASAPGDLAQQIRPLPDKAPVVAYDGLELWGAPFEQPASPRGETPFRRIEGPEVGFQRPPLPRPYVAMEQSVMHMGALAAGDFNGSGWPDVAVGTHAGVHLYVNLGGHFALQEIDFPRMRDWTIGDVAFVDLDGDGRLDLFFTTWMQGSHILFNRDGEFTEAAHTELPRSEETAVHAAAFADVNRNGRVDIVTGATTHVPRFFYPGPAVNHIWYNQGEGRFRPEALEGPEGETLTLLFTDLTGDSWPDLFVGNDFDEPDRIYLNDRGRLRPITADESPIARTTYDTMSADAADTNNDGRDELYIGGIAMADGYGEEDSELRTRDPLSGCEVYERLADRVPCDSVARFQLATFSAYGTVSADPCGELADPTQQRDCLVSSYHWHRVLARLPVRGADKDEVLAECGRIPADYETMRDICTAIGSSPMDYERSDEVFVEELPQVKETNLFYARDGDRYQDLTDEAGVAVGGWTWNAKFADLDNDTWQDLFIAQGTRLRPDSVSSIYYRNQSGSGFEDRTRQSGLEEFNPTGASLFLDYDLDGDLDLITYPFLLAPVVWENEAPGGPGLQLRLDDRLSENRYGIGARVEIRSPNGRLQVREIKASGGYQSHDEPLARFGLGDWPSVASLTVTWPDGDTRTLDDLELTAGRYRLVRAAE